MREQATSIEKCYHTALKRVKLPSHITVSATDLAQLPPVLASEEQLCLVFFNLIDNALDALGEQTGHIEVYGVWWKIRWMKRAGSRDRRER